MKKRILSIILCLVMLASLLPMQASAATKEVTEAKLEERLAKFIAEVYPNGGKYKDEGDGSECFGFANYLAQYIFGSHPSSYMRADAGVDSNWKITRGSGALKNVTKGDIIRVNLHGKTDHSMFVTLVTPDRIYFSDANWNHANGVRHYASMTRTQLENYLDRKLQLPDTKPASVKGYVAHYKGFVPDIDTVKPSAPTGLKGTWVATTDGSCVAKISWKAADNADYYQVQFKRDGIDWKTDGDYTKPVYLNYKSKDLNGYNTYSYRVRAVNEAGKSAWSEVLTINKKVKITFDPNGGTVSPTSMTATYKKGVPATYKSLPTPTRDGYTFLGWYTSLTGTTKVENSTKITATKNYTIYAHWEIPGANWSAVTYTWSEDCSSVTAARYALSDSSITETETVKTTLAVTEPATCEDEGSGIYTAKFTNPAFAEQTKDVDIPALGHDLVAQAGTAATCTEAGHSAYQACSRCDYMTAFEEIPALGHDWNDGEITVAPTDTAKGEKVFTCLRCGETRTEILPDLSHTHSCTDEITAPTCTEKGYTTHTCGCGYSYVDTYVDALGHAWDDGEITFEQKDAEYMEMTYTCTRCGETRIEVIPLSAEDTCPHNSTHRIKRSTTCTEDGIDRTTCVLCGKVLAEEIFPALGHTFVDGYCIRCGAPQPADEPTEPTTDPTEPTTPTEPSEPTGPAKPCDGGMDCPSREFMDVNYGNWYHEAVDFAVTMGLMNGIGRGIFAPNDPMTRAMLVTVLWRYEGQPMEGTNNFADVSAGQWYTEAVAWAAKNGIVNGVGAGRFDPSGKITREQLAAILFRYSAGKGYDVSGRDAFAGFPDKAKVSSWATDAYGWAVAERLITGNDGRLDPQGNATRAQVATILMRFIEGIAKK